MNVTVISKINLDPAIRKIESDDFWKYSAKEWWRLYYDLVPHKSNDLRQHVKIRPKEIEHIQPYSAYIYYGLKMVDPKYNVGGFTTDNGNTWFSRRGVRKKRTNSLLELDNGSRLWDEKAVSEKKDLLLISSMQKWIDKNL